MFKYTKIYSGGRFPEIKEMDTFKVSVHYVGEGVKTSNRENEVFDGTIDGTIDGASQQLKNNLIKLLKAIAKSEGKRTPYYRLITNIGSERTIERYMQQLRDANLIEFRGTALQTGGYFLTDEIRKKMNLKKTI